MDKQDIQHMQAIINDYGAIEAFKGFLKALRNAADESSDLGLKERAITLANLADQVRPNKCLHELLIA